MQIRNLVFEGGGIKCITYGGALKGLMEEIDFNGVVRVGGTSAGAIFSLLVALNYGVDEIQDMFLGMDFKKFMDGDFGFIRDTSRLLTQFGWYRGDAFTQWVQDVVDAKTGDPNTTFEQLKNMTEKGKQKFKDLYIVGYNLNTGNAEVFCHENTHAQVPIALAARISGSIPIIFKPVFLNEAYYVDGGVIRNYPITLFDDWKYNPNIPNETLIPFNQETLGFRLDTQANIKKLLNQSIDNKQYPITSFFNYTHALISMIDDMQNEAHFHSFDQFRTIYCDSLNVQSTEFKISVKKRQQMLDSGYNCVKQFFTEEAYQTRLNQRSIYKREWAEFGEIAMLRNKNKQHWINVTTA